MCTYIQTSYERHYQHFYKCNTCGKDDLCIVCKEVCHHGHDLDYIGYDYRFCWCGGIRSESCMALTPRTSTPVADTALNVEPTASSSLLHNQGKYSISTYTTHCVLLEHYYSVNFPWRFDRKNSKYFVTVQSWTFTQLL